VVWCDMQALQGGAHDRQSNCVCMVTMKKIAVFAKVVEMKPTVCIMILEGNCDYYNRDNWLTYVPR
jgi:hypothetical protein